MNTELQFIAGVVNIVAIYATTWASLDKNHNDAMRAFFITLVIINSIMLARNVLQ